MNQYSFSRYAFISYCHSDVKWAKWLHKRLEWYKLPNEIHNEFEKSHYLRPIFRDQTDLNAGILNEELQRKLLTSKFLIVICSCQSSNSGWVDKEVKSFIDAGRISQIIPFVIDDCTHGHEVDSFLPPSLRSHYLQYPEDELLCICKSEVGKDKAFIRIVSKMLEIDFDTLWRRHQKEIRRRVSLTAISAFVLLSSFYWFCVPVSIVFDIYDETHKLPPLEYGVLSVLGKEYNLSKLDTTIYLGSFPGYIRKRNINYSITCTGRYEDIKAGVCITPAVRQVIDVQMHRNKEYATFYGKVINNKGDAIPDVLICIEGMMVKTDNDGKYQISFPLEKQSEHKEIEVSCAGYQTRHLPNVTPGKNNIILSK